MALTRRTQTVTTNNGASPMELPRPTPALHIMGAVAYAVAVAMFLAALVIGYENTSDVPELRTVLLFAAVPAMLAELGLLVYIVVWFALHTAPYWHALMELLAGEDLDDSGAIGDVRTDTESGLADYLRNVATARTRKTVESKTAQHWDDEDLMEFTRKCLGIGIAASKNTWTGANAQKNLPSRRAYDYTDWRTKLIQPHIDAGNIAVKTGKDGREWPEWTETQWTDAVFRLAEAGFLPTVRNKLTAQREA